jgi:hypothetical protein
LKFCLLFALNVTLCNKILQFEEEPNRRQMTKMMVSATGVFMFALKTIFQQQLGLLPLLQVMPALVCMLMNVILM